MAGFAAFIGGAGDEASKYGHQVRSLLESRRGHFIDFLSRAATEESNPELRRQMHSTVADLMAGKDMAQIAPKFVQALQKHHEGNAALGQMAQQIAPPPQQPKTVPAPQVGVPPGKGVAAMPESNPTQPGMQDLISGMPRQQLTSPVAGPQPEAMLGPPLNYQAQETPQYPPPQAQLPSQPQPQMSPVQSGSSMGQFQFGQGGLPNLNIRDPRELALETIQSPMYEAPANRHALDLALTQQLSHNEALRQTLTQAQAELYIGLQKLGLMADSPEVKAVTERLKASGYPEFMIPVMVAGAFKIPMPSTYGMMSAMFTPDKQTMTADAVIRNWPKEAAEAGIVAGNNPVNVEINKITRRPVLIGDKPIRNAFGVGYDPATGSFVPTLMNPFGAPGPVAQTGPVQPVVPSQATPIYLPTPTGVEKTSAAEIAKGAPPKTVPGAVSPPMLPTQSNTVMPVQTYDADNRPVTLIVPKQTTSGKVGAGIPPVPAPSLPSGSSGVAFQKPLTPEQIVRHQQQLGQYNLAIERMTSIKSKLHLLDSMLNAGKLNLALDSGGLVRAAVGRLTLTPAEAEFLGDFRTMMEDINLLRGPMGATGFRGPEAWAALQAQRGQLLANPAITRQVMDNSIKALKAQQKPLEDVLNPNQEQKPAGQGLIITLPSGKKVVIE